MPENEQQTTVVNDPPKQETPTTPQSTETKETPSLINQPPVEGKVEEKPEEKKPEVKAEVPEKYEFKVPEGFELNPEVAEAASAVFKAHGLNAEQAQAMFDLHNSLVEKAAQEPIDLWADTQKKWVEEIKADPEIGGKLDEVKKTVSKAVNSLVSPEQADAFRTAMDFTGAGNNPAIIRGFYALAQKLVEGGFVTGNGPSKPSQTKPGDAVEPSAAQAMYPSLPSRG